MPLFPGWEIKEGTGAGGEGKAYLSSPNSCVRATNDHKSAAFTVFCGPTLSSLQNETKEWRDDEVPSSAGQVFPQSPGSWGLHLPTTNPLWWIDEAVTDSATLRALPGIRAQRTWLKHTVIPQTITHIHLGGPAPLLSPVLCYHWEWLYCWWWELQRAGWEGAAKFQQTWCLTAPLGYSKQYLQRYEVAELWPLHIVIEYWFRVQCGTHGSAPTI